MARDLTAMISRALQLTSRLDQTAVLQNLAEGALATTGAKSAMIVLVSSLGEPTNILLAGKPGEGPSEAAARRFVSSIIHLLPAQGIVIGNDGISALRQQLAETCGRGGSVPSPSSSTPGVSRGAGVTAAAGAEEDWLHRQLIAAISSVGKTVGYLFIFNKPAAFDAIDTQNIELLVSAAAIAVENARLYEESNSRARWIAASRAITSELLKGSDEEDALRLIANEMRKVAQADAALIILPSVGDMWMCEIADGRGTEDLVGTLAAPEGLALRVAREGRGRVIGDISAIEHISEKLKRFAPVLYAPMAARGESKGVIVLGRTPGSQEFDLADLSMAENVASQATLALELASARHVQAQAAQLEDRSRISRDLHDFAIQQLFASGMALSAAKADLSGEATVPPKVLQTLDHAISSIDESVGQIRQIIYSLRDPDATVPILNRLRREVSAVTSQLGFDPAFEVLLLGENITDSLSTELDDALGADLSDDIVAVVREGLSNAVRHAQPNSIWVRVEVANHRAIVTVEDDGVGVKETGRRSGLSNLAARAQRHHGTFSISPRADSGTRLRWTAAIS